jgi:threonine dehydrogenase-like Zn-dependent dehydrogenase
MAPFMLVEEKDLVSLPDELSYADGAQVACGFGTAYEALVRLAVSGLDTILVTGLGPVGLGALMLAKAMGSVRLIGVDVNQERCALALNLGLATDVFNCSAEALSGIEDLTKGRGVEKALDCSGHNEARQLCVRAVGSGGAIGLVGEGGEMNLNPSPDLIHGSKTIVGSWVTSIWRMEELVNRIARWQIHPDILITHRYPLSEAANAYAMMASGQCGKVAVTFE